MFGKSHRAAVILLAVLSSALVLPTSAFAIGGPPPVEMRVSPYSRDVQAGGSAAFELDVFLNGGLKVGRLNLSAANLPQGVTVTFDPDMFTIPGEYPFTSKMTVKVAEDAPPRETELHVEGVAFYYAMGNGNSRVYKGGTLVTLNITAPPAKTTTSTTTSTVTMRSTITQTATSTQTTTSTEQVTDPTAYVWAVGATAAAAVFAAILVVRRRGNR